MKVSLRFALDEDLKLRRDLPDSDHIIPISENFSPIPNVGDMVCFDWLWGGEIFVVQSKIFIWDEPQQLGVHIGLREQGPIPHEQL